MNRDDDTDRLLHAWLDEGAMQAPERVVWAALEETERIPQRRAWVRALDGLLLRFRPAAGVLGVAAVLALAAYLLLAGRNMGDTSPTPRVVTLEDLTSIVVWEDTAPRGWRLDNLVSNPREVLVIPIRSLSGSELDAMEEPRGYLGGRYTDFSGQDAIFISWATLFDSENDAQAALAFYLNEMAAGDAWGLGPGQPARLGDEGRVFTGETRALMGGTRGDPVPARIYLWRVGNLLLAAGGWFEYDPQELRAVAEGMDARAR